MKRLTTNDPNSNTENILNLFYVKNGEAWVRGGGDFPEYPDISLYDFIRNIAERNDVKTIDSNLPNEELGELLYESLFDGADTLTGLISTLYNAGWAFAELRERLDAYEDTGLTPEEVKAYAESKKNGGKIGHYWEWITGLKK